MSKLICGTRGSELALAQTREFLGFLKERTDVEVEVRIVKTTGDRILDRPLHEFKGMGAFVKTLDDLILKHEIDFAVHSMKDIPIQQPNEICIPAVLKRESPCDVIVSEFPFKELPDGCHVGTSSLRRKAELLRMNKNVKIKELRGNITTRLKKWREEKYDAIVIAEAGLMRMDLHPPYRVLDINEFPTSAGQGAVAVTARKNDTGTITLLKMVDHYETRLETDVERAILRRLGGGCFVPIGVTTRLSNNSIRIVAGVFSTDGEKNVIIRTDIPASPFETVMEKVEEIADEMNERGGGKIIEQTLRAMD